MAIIPQPALGQPLDVTYIYKIVEAINKLAAQITTSTYKYLSVDVPGQASQNIKTSDARIIGGYKEVVNTATVSVGDEKPFEYSFSDFKFAPIVTATAINVGNTPAGRNVTVILKSISTTKVEGIVKFNSSGDLTVGVNLIIVGIPN